MLRSQVNTPRNGVLALGAFITMHNTVHQNPQPVFEHDHWWITCSTCGAQFDAVDAEGGASVNGWDFEMVSEGDNFCWEHQDDEA